MSGRIVLAVFFVATVAPMVPGMARAQVTGDTFGPADTATALSTRTPIMYDTSYDRDVSTGTWTQSLLYSLNRRRVSLTANGSSTTVDFTRSRGLGGRNGSFGGALTYSVSRNWQWLLNGTFGRVSSTDIVSETSQRQNRLKVSSQYTVAPLRGLSLLGVVSSEFQRDEGLTVRPLGQERLRLLTRYDASGDSIGVDSIFVHDQRDSTQMTGRQDGINLQATWKPRSWLQVLSNASGTRVNPVTTTALRDFARALDGSQLEVSTKDRIESPNSSRLYDTKATYTGTNRVLAWAQFKGTYSNQQYFDKSLRDQEHLTINQNAGIGHAEYTPFFGVSVGVDGLVSRSESGYVLRSSRSSLLTSKSAQSYLNYSPSPRSRASMSFSLDYKRNERQLNGNGTNISRYLSANGSHRLSPRLVLDGSGSVSLTTFQYVDSILDQDNVRTYVNVGTGYTVSERCSTTVHFSAARGHTVALDPSRSGNNNMQSTYQMDASMRLGLGPALSINQYYLLNAVYQIYDGAQAESRNVLSRIRRIDTIVADTLLRHATILISHNFLFRDSGSYRKPLAGGGRQYNVGSETYQQTFTVTFTVRPLSGLEMSVTQSLGNTRIYFPSTNTQVVDNRWNLNFGAALERNILGGATIKGSAQHIGAYTERREPADPLNEQNDWIVGVALHKEI